MKFKINDYVAMDTPHKLSREVIDYGVKMVGAPLEWKETQGEGIKVGIIDTGIDIDHEDLKGRVADFYNFTSNESKNVLDDNGHGTHVAGIIAANKNRIGVIGVAPRCELYIAKAFNSDGAADTRSVINALQWLMSKKVNIINMSFNTKEYVSDYSSLIKRCTSQGIVCVCSAGNEGNGPDTIEYPARFPETISVTAIDINKRIAPFSSTGERADIAAPGKDILSTFPNDLYVTLSGTSMAAPLIAGSVALIQVKAKKRFGRYLKPEEVKLFLNMYADDLGPIGKDNEYGYGVFSFGRINPGSSFRPSENLSSNVPANIPTYTTPRVSNMQNVYTPMVNPYWKVFNHTLMLKMMGFDI